MIKRRSRLASVHLALAAAACAWVITLGASSLADLRRRTPPKAFSEMDAAKPRLSSRKARRTPPARRPRRSTSGRPRRATAASAATRPRRDPHPTPQWLSCADCHGGNGTATTKEQAHPRPRHADAWPTAANPHESYTLLNRERHEWIRFVNPSDLRVAPVVCGRCHSAIVRTVQKGSMVNSAQVYSTALYNNASVPFKDAQFVENYTPRGLPQILRTIPPPTAEETRTLGILPQFFPLPRFETGQPGTILRAFERGGGPEVGARQSRTARTCRASRTSRSAIAGSARRARSIR